MDEAALLDHVVEAVKRVEGITGIVLGGSRSTGTHNAESDFDVGLFYRGQAEFDLDALERVAAALDDEHRPKLVTPIGGWGPWVVGGGWLRIRSSAVDFIYRDIERVARVIADCRNGVVDIQYQPAYTLGYVTTTYMAEIDACRLLWDPSGELAALKALTRPYPELLRRAMLDTYAWMPPFAVVAGRKCAPRGDVTFASSCVYWSTAALCEMLFALNGEYCLNPKGGVARVETLAVRPANFRARIERAFTLLRPESTAIHAAFDELGAVVEEVERLHRARYPLA